MKIQPKIAAGNGTNRISALKRLSKPTANNNNVHHRLSASTTPVVTDARQLLTNRQKPIFDARQLLSRQSSKTQNTSLPKRQNMVEIDYDEEEDEEEEEDDNEELPDIEQQKTLLITRPNDRRLTSNRPSFLNTRNTGLTEPVSFTKTIKNTTLRREDDKRSSQTLNSQPISTDQKVVISFVNDQYRKRPKSPTPPPIVRRLHDSSAQTAHASSSARSPIRTSTSHKHLDDDHYEPPIKRINSRNPTTDLKPQTSTTSSKNSLKRTSTDAFSSTRAKPASSSHSNSNATTVLITNLQSTVTEDDVIELFSEVGDINDIKTLSRGCVEIIYAKSEQAEDAVAKYHNRLLDGKLMYVSLQQPMAYTTKSSKLASSQHSKSTTAKDNNSSTSSKTETSQSTSNKIGIDPAFIRQALFNPSNNTTNAVQFQVKL